MNKDIENSQKKFIEQMNENLRKIGVYAVMVDIPKNIGKTNREIAEYLAFDFKPLSFVTTTNLLPRYPFKWAEFHAWKKLQFAASVRRAPCIVCLQWMYQLNPRYRDCCSSACAAQFYD